jgi:CDP-diacylglycerol--glycerol-3-phosphate 3-phosphatidyltransferase
MHADQSAQPVRKSLSDWMRVWFKGVLDPIAGFLNRLGLHPNTITLVGMAGNLIAAIFLARGEFVVAGVLVFLMGPVDALDGAMARLKGEASDFGAFVDSVTDRYSELVIFLGLLTYYLLKGDAWASWGVFVAAGGSVLVSYTKARAESLGFDGKIGILSRFERFLVLVPSLVLGFPKVGIWLIAVLANVTAVQRALYVRRQARRASKG